MNQTKNILFSVFKIVLPVSLILLFSIGCALLPAQKNPLENKEPYTLHSANIMRPALLKEGRSIVVVPFSAGPNVEATQDLERVSLMIVKGTVGALNDNSHLKVFSSADADKPDLVIQGHITHREIDAKGARKWLLFHSKENVLALEARVTERTTGNLVVIFSQQRKADIHQKDELTLAREMGKEIAEFLLKQLK